MVDFGYFFTSFFNTIHYNLTNDLRIIETGITIQAASTVNRRLQVLPTISTKQSVQYLVCFNDYASLQKQLVQIMH